MIEHQNISGAKYCLLASFEERLFQQSLIVQLVLFFMFIYLF